MEKQWIGKNVNLALFSKNIEDFLKAKGYKTVYRESEKEYRISATLQENIGSTGVLVRIYGNPSDFVVELGLAGEARLSRVLGSVTALFGGGSLFLRGLRSEEALQKLEEGFWLFAEETVTRLVDSTRESP